MNIRIYDMQFPQGKSFGTGGLQIPPTYFQWMRSGASDITVFTESMFHVAHKIDCKIKVGIILESPAVYDYTWIRNNYDIFDHVLTFNRELLSISDKFKWYPFGGCWIRPEDWKMYPKTKFCSIIASDKKITAGHKLRWEVIEKYGSKIDVFGRGHNPIDYKLDALRDYKYSIVIENDNCDDMFSEKVIDCFLTGTIPIYWGTDNLGKYFHSGLCFDDIVSFEHLYNNIIPNNLKYTGNLLGSFDKAKKYAIPEDWIWLNYFSKWIQ